MKRVVITLICAFALVQGGKERGIPRTAPAICAAENSESVLVAHENCNQFYKCSEGRPIAFDCQPGLLYDPDKEWCDWADSVDCGNRIIPDDSNNGGSGGDNNNGGSGGDNNNGGGNDDPSQGPAICAKEGSDGVLVAHENCNQFYKCSEGLPVALNCQPGLLYVPEKEWCDWADSVDCGNRIIPDGSNNGGSGGDNNNGGSGGDDNNGGSGGDNNNGSSGENNNNGGGNDDSNQAAVICAAQGSDSILLAHENCNQFYKCSEGIPAAFNCQPGLLYNPANEWCDWPQNVDCGDRIKP